MPKYRVDAEIVNEGETLGYLAVFSEGDDIAEALIASEDQLKIIVPEDSGLTYRITAICEEDDEG